jgi:hypothetical protein
VKTKTRGTARFGHEFAGARSETTSCRCRAAGRGRTRRRRRRTVTGNVRIFAFVEMVRPESAPARPSPCAFRPHSAQTMLRLYDYERRQQTPFLQPPSNFPFRRSRYIVDSPGRQMIGLTNNGGSRVARNSRLVALASDLRGHHHCHRVRHLLLHEAPQGGLVRSSSRARLRTHTRRRDRWIEDLRHRQQAIQLPNSGCIGKRPTPVVSREAASVILSGAASEVVKPAEPASRIVPRRGRDQANGRLVHR